MNQALRELRKHVKLSQADFADPLNTQRETIAKIELGSQNLGADLGLRILKAYRADMAEMRMTLEDLLKG